MPEPAKGTAFDSGAYCSAAAGGIAAIDGADVITCLFNADGTKLLAVAGEKDTKVSISADTKSFSSKDSKGAWKVQRASTKSFDVSVETVLVKDAESDKIIRKALEDGTALCIKQVFDNADYTPIGGGSVIVTKYEVDAPSDDVMTASISLSGTGKWTWFDLDTEAKSKATAKPAE